MYKKLLIATTNPNKVQRIRALLPGFPLPILSLNDIGKDIPEPQESAKNCVGIAMQKAVEYLDYVDDETIVLTQDDTIVFDGVDSTDNPGTAIKLPVIESYGEFTDELAIKYYTNLAKKYGGFVPMTFHYGHAVAVKSTAKRPSAHVYASESILEARLTDTAHKPDTVPGYFLSAIMQVQVNGKWVHHTEVASEDLLILDGDIKESLQYLLNTINDNPTKA